MESIYGTIRKVVFRSDTFHILQVTTSGKGKALTVKGHFLGVLQLVEGASLQFFGEWVEDRRFGQQFGATGWRPWANSRSCASVFLTSCIGMFPWAAINKLMQAFDVNVFKVLTETPEKVLETLVSEKAIAEELLETWKYVLATSDMSEFFSDYDITSEQMMGIVKIFGADAKRVVQENPYDLVRVDSLGFAKVDEIALRLGVQRNDPRRFEGAVLWVVREAVRNGHLCVRRGDIPGQLIDLVQGSEEVGSFSSTVGLRESLFAAVDRLAERKLVVVDPDVGVYLPEHYRFERESAEMLAKLLTPVNLGVQLDTFLESYESSHEIKLSEAQREGVEKLLSSKVLVLTGLPGTGKTTLVKTFVSLFREANLSISLMAPTGIAAKRLAAVTLHDASTVHRALKYNGTVWGHDRNNRIPAQAVIVDEMSMVDQELLFRIVDALKEDTFLVLMGDDAQLPSVGPGNVLRELASSGVIPTVRLTQIFRQKESSDIVRNSHRINRGEQIQIRGKDSDFQFAASTDEEQIANAIVEMAKKLKARDANFQVLSPKYDGTCGVNALNEALREALNPASDTKVEASFGPLRVREGDRLMVIQNDYDLNVYNGDVGKLMSVEPDGLTVKIHGGGEQGLDRPVTFPRKDVASKLRLAYAITVHKSQGSEFDTIILPVVRSHGRMLVRNLLYTGVTRAKTKVWLLGEMSAVAKAIANDKVVQRQTGLAKAIQEWCRAGVVRGTES